MSDQYAAITAHGGQCPVPRRCRALEVSLRGFSEARARIARAAGRPARRRMTRVVIGARRVCEESRALRAQGVHVEKHRIARIVRPDGMRARRARS